MPDVLRFTLRQKITFFATRYTLQGRYVDGLKGPLVAHAEQKRFTLRRHITFFADEARTQPLFGFAGRRGTPSPGGYEITDADDRVLGEFQKDYAASLLRSTWLLSTHDGLTAVGQERSRGVAIARRFLDAAGGADPLRYHFDFVTDDGQVVLSSECQRTIRDSYEITIPVLADGRQLDWRVGAAMAVALDVLQHR
jgi:hypothetical protein